MFIDTFIALISSENLEASAQLKDLGVKKSIDLDKEDFEYRPFRIRIDDIKYIYQALEKDLLVLELYDTDGQFMLKDDLDTIKSQMDDYYTAKP
jgi:hypothetical protein